jgi:hypothetical protein
MLFCGMVFPKIKKGKSQKFKLLFMSIYFQVKGAQFTGMGKDLYENLHF